MDAEEVGAAEELLLQQRALIDRSLHPLEEDAPLDELLRHFHHLILNLKHQEPSFWQLNVVEFIRKALKTRVGDRILAVVKEAAKNSPEDPTDVVTSALARTKQSEELEETLQHLQQQIEAEITRLTEVLNTEEEDHCQLSDSGEHFLERFWTKLQHSATTGGAQPGDDGERGSEDAEEIEDSSFDMLTFDDDLDEISRSAMSFPCLEDFPATICKMQSADGQDRTAGLDELMQMPIVEIIQSGPVFPAACAAIAGLLLDTDSHGGIAGTAERAKRVVCDLVTNVDDSAQFLELYWAVFDFLGMHMETGDMFLERQSISESTDTHSIAVLDCFRVLHALLCNVMRHWVYFSTEALAGLFISTFRLLITYSKSETEVEAKRINPLMALTLIDNEPMRWFKLWLLNSPSRAQLFVALEESGFIAELLQRLSRVRPLAEMKTQLTVNSNEKRFIQGMLAILSYICEYSEGRNLISRWQRIPAHAYIKQRHTRWEKPVIQCNPTENDSLYYVVRSRPAEEEFDEDLEADYTHLGEGAADALILSIVSMIAIAPTQPECPCEMSFDEVWASYILKSVSNYLHVIRCDVFRALIKVIDACWSNSSFTMRSAKELELESPWFPFREPKDTDDVCQMIIDCMSRRIRRSALTKPGIIRSGGILLLSIISSKIVLDRAFEADIMVSIFELCQRFLRGWQLDANVNKNRGKQLAQIANLTIPVRAFKMANKIGLIDDIVETITSSNIHTMLGMRNSVAWARYVHSTSSSGTYVRRILTLWSDVKALNFLEILICFATTPSTMAFFMDDTVQSTIFRLVITFQESDDFAMVLNSPEEEVPPQLMNMVKYLLLLRCCVSTQYASMVLCTPDNQCNLVTQFITETLSKHNRLCMTSSNAEDTCCVAFQLALALVSSVPAMLTCSRLYSELNIIHLDDKSCPQCEWLSSDGESLGSCSLLEQQLRYEFNFIGGPSEKIPRCELFEFDGLSRKSSICKDLAEAIVLNDNGVSAFSSILHHKILQAIKEGTENSSPASMDFVLISQASWELVNELESEIKVTSSVAARKVTTEFTDVFAKLMYTLVMSKRSRLEASRAETQQTANNVANASQPAETFFPSDSERKLMNRLYKNYAQRLSLEVSPTVLHATIKMFGKLSMDAFPVTIIMILYPNYEEADILAFLSYCFTSPASGFLWPKTAECTMGTDSDLAGSFAIAEAVGCILENEFPQVLQAIDQCQCSLLSLVQRWHGQSFWNYFDWENIVIYIYFNVLYGAEFQVYTIVAILKHLEPAMRGMTRQFSSRSLMPFLKLIREPIRNFHFSPWRTLLLHLRSEYHEEVEGILFPSKVPIVET